ncbi:glycerol-3-phosphate dehydrogenase [Marinomonas sp. 15G1-11]|uniref:Glycerol-3-phosphate dehydrogenase n=1 Tax=Marinomonas phaeophyticola TaxID=3004091 RepID=A0ABT4JUT0_9GAMM|nr:glycerol-3-phosphate dehydrogenase [Marinomonas sp. 15G1-11]MCZ2722155.1 glycerol-3-phosphate dehydrogenase [Marinomonas sp. 15G1-11]
MSSTHFDLFVVGGGINGTGIAADAAGRGLTVGLCEMNDLASATSSNSSKLIHGGLRYLEHYEFRLVREALSEREVLLKIAPHIVTPMRFQMPHRPHLRPAFLIRLGLFLYDHLGKREALPGSKGVKYGAASPLKSEITQGFEYSDCWVDDARLVVLNALSAQKHGAKILDRTRCVGAKRVNGKWQIELQKENSDEIIHVTANGLVNAAGPWVSSFIQTGLKQKAPYGIRMIKGSHIVVPKLYSDSNAFIMQNEDKRIVFAIPYRENYTLIGTTDEEYKGDPSKVAISQEETDYILSVANKHFKKQLTKEDVVWNYSGVRPLLEDESSDASAVTRDYTLHVADENGKAPLLSIFGGKITTYRKLALSAMEDLQKYYPNLGSPWTDKEALPGGNLNGSLSDYAATLKQRYPFLTLALAKRYANSYGTLSERFLADKVSIEELGEDFGQSLYQAEVDYLVDHEWAHTAKDILWRRTKLGIEFTDTEVARLTAYLESK